MIQHFHPTRLIRHAGLTATAAVCLGLLGCGGDADGDGDVSQKFEKPEGVPAKSAPPVDVATPYNEKKKEIEKAHSEPLTRPTKTGKKK